MVESGQVDIALSKLSKTLDRNERVSFTNTYIKLFKVLMINRLQEAKIATDSTDPFVKLNRSGVSFGTPQNSSFQEFTRREFPNVDVKLYGPRAELFNDLYDGKITAAYMD